MNERNAAQYGGGLPTSLSARMLFMQELARHDLKLGIRPRAAMMEVSTGSGGGESWSESPEGGPGAPSMLQVRQPLQGARSEPPTKVNATAQRRQGIIQRQTLSVVKPALHMRDLSPRRQNHIPVRRTRPPPGRHTYQPRPCASPAGEHRPLTVPPPQENSRARENRRRSDLPEAKKRRARDRSERVSTQMEDERPTRKSFRPPWNSDVHVDREELAKNSKLKGLKAANPVSIKKKRRTRMGGSKRGRRRTRIRRASQRRHTQPPTEDVEGEQKETKPQQELELQRLQQQLEQLQQQQRQQQMLLQQQQQAHEEQLRKQREELKAQQEMLWQHSSTHQQSSEELQRHEAGESVHAPQSDQTLPQGAIDRKALPHEQQQEQQQEQQRELQQQHDQQQPHHQQQQHQPELRETRTTVQIPLVDIEESRLILNRLDEVEGSVRARWGLSPLQESTQSATELSSSVLRDGPKPLHFVAARNAAPKWMSPPRAAINEESVAEAEAKDTAKERALSAEDVLSIERNRELYEEYRRESNSSLCVTEVEPWKIVEDLADTFLRRALRDVAAEMGGLCDGFVVSLFNSEFAKPEEPFDAH